MKKIKEFARKIYYLNSFLAFNAYGKNIMLSKGGTILRPEEISLGNNIFISEKFHISAQNLKIGNDVMIGPNLVIECDNHSYHHVGKTMFDTRDQRIIGFVTIENDVWIGANVTILAGTVIAEGSVIGAGSLVNRVLPPYSICFGTPCKPVRPRFSLDELNTHIGLVKSNYDFETIKALWIENGLLTEN